MGIKSERLEKAQAKGSAGQPLVGFQGLPSALLRFGALLLLAATLGTAYALLQHWVQAQDRHLWAQGTTPASVTGVSQETPEVLPTGSSVPAGGLVGSTSEEAAPESATQPPDRPRAAQIQIPSLGVTRSVVNAPRTRDRESGAWTWNVDRLLRQGRPDLVGHLEGSANPGEAGNMILAGHNYGYGTNGVFLRLGRLKPGKRINIINKEGETFAYSVVEVVRIKWKGNKGEQLARHWEYLSLSGPERLTLMTCGGANIEPFPLRIYVVAEPLVGGRASSP